MEKKILDVTCGARTIWFNKQHNELPHDWTKVAEAMRKAEREIREAVK